ncbi:MAG: WD40/YVTN/BNR-like repeat-containing protein [Thermoanaerobaculia bacterium]
MPFILATLASPCLGGVNSWTTGGPAGESIGAIVVDPTSPQTLYAASSHGVFKTIDGGASWSPASDGLEEDYIGSLVIDPRSPATLWAGGRSGGSVYKTTDGARTWSRVALLGNGGGTSVDALVIDPTDSLILYAAAPEVSNNGIFKTTDGGEWWFPVNQGLPCGFSFLGSCSGVYTPTKLLIDPNDTSVLYAVGGVLGSGGYSYRTTDGGAHWSQFFLFYSDFTDVLIDSSSTIYSLVRGGSIYRGMPRTLIGYNPRANGLALDPSDGSTLYLLEAGDPDPITGEPVTVIRKSIDHGWTWTGLPNSLRYQNVRTLVVAPTGRDLHIGTGLASYSLASANGVYDYEITKPVPPPVPVIPIVVDVATAAAHYTTELTLTNDTASPQAVTLVYTASLGSREGSGSVSDRLLPGEQRRIGDVLSYLRGNGLAIPDSAEQTSQGGTLQVLTPDLHGGEGRVSALARTTSDTRPPLPPGRAGLAYPAFLARPESAALRIFGLRSSDSDRSNLAIVNTSPDEMEYRVTVFSGSGDGRSIVLRQGQTLPPWGWTQINSPELLEQPGITNGWALVERTSDFGGLGAYGVVNDGVTNDGSFLSPSWGEANGVATVPVLAETGTFESELVLANRSDAERKIQLVYVESLSPENGAGGSLELTLPARQQWILPGAIDFLRQKGLPVGPRGGSYAGSLAVGADVGVFAGARTAARSGGGEFGLFAPYVKDPAGSWSYMGEKAWVYGLVADGQNRSNVAVACISSAAGLSLRLQVHDGDAGGAPKGDPLSAYLNDGQWKQFDNILKSAGVTNGWVEITQDNSYGYWFAYGVINDGGNAGERTGDGAYVPMVK